MHKPRAFRPSVSDRLEERVVPAQASTASVAAAAVATNVNTAYQLRTFNYGQIANLINGAFNTFRTDYNTALNSFLNPGTGTSMTLSQLQSFTTQRAGLLAQAIQNALIQVPGASNGLTPFILNGVNGQSGASMLAMLNAIPGDTGPNGTPSALYGSIANGALNAAQLAANNLLSAYAWGVGTGQASYGSTTTVPVNNYAQVASQLNSAFGSFRTNFNNQLGNFLGSSISASQLQANTTQQTAGLLEQLRGAFNGVSGASNGLSPFTNGQINGSFAGAMLSSLNGIPTNTGTNGAPDTLYALAAANALNGAQLAANDLASAYAWGLNQGIAYAGLYTSGGNGQVFTQTQLANAQTPAQLAIGNANLQQLRTAYQTFQTAFNNAVQNTLYGNTSAGANGTVDLSANQQALNTQVGLAANALNTSLANTFGNSAGATNSFLPALQQAITGTNGLQGQLAALALPTDINGASNTAFTSAANTLINQSFLDTGARMNMFAVNNNFGFSGYNSFGAFNNGPYGASFANFPTSMGTNFGTGTANG